jgi:hypothetical protein
LKYYKVGLECPGWAVEGMGIERIVKNSRTYGTHSYRQVVFCYSHRNQIPGRIYTGAGTWRLEGPATTFVGQVALFFSPCRNLMMRTGEQGAVPQQFTMKTFTPQFDLKGRNGFRHLRIPGCPIGGHRRVNVGVRVP